MMTIGIPTENYVYKVVRKYHDDWFGSAIVPNSASNFLEYKLGQRTIPGDGLIFVFKDLENAEKFAKIEGLSVILKCKYSGELTELKYRCSSISFFKDYRLHDAWNIIYGVLSNFYHPTRSAEIIESPKGTYGVESLTPIEIIN